jgi:hypothetical protein
MGFSCAAIGIAACQSLLAARRNVVPEASAGIGAAREKEA